MCLLYKGPNNFEYIIPSVSMKQDHTSGRLLNKLVVVGPQIITGLRTMAYYAYW